MNTNSNYRSKYANVFDLANNAKEVLTKLYTFIEEHCLIALPTADNTKDTRPLGFSDGQLRVLKTYPILDPDQDYISMTDKQRNAILVQNLNSAQDRIKKMEYNAKDDYCHILVAGDTNSGKSAFINGLLRRKILPSGGRALTSTFVEVFDAQDIGGREEAHLCKRGVDYDCKNVDTFKRENIDDLYGIMYDWYNKQYDIMYDTIKVYVDYHRVHDNFFDRSEREARITDSIGRNINGDKVSSLLKKQEVIDVLIYIIDARYGLTKSSIKVLEHYRREKTPIFTVITHIDCVCCCRGKCHRSCKEDCKQEIIDAIEEALSVEFGSTNELIHCVNPTLVPMWDNKSDYARREIPSEWIDMEECLNTFIYKRFNFRKLSPIVNYLKKLMHDVILLSQLNEAIIASRIDETTRKVHKLQNSISQLKDRLHDKAYIKAKKKIDATIYDIRDYILWAMHGLKENPEKLVSIEMISRIDSNITEAELYKLLQERWKEVEEECSRKVNEHIQNYVNYIDQLVKDLPKSSMHDEKTYVSSYTKKTNRRQTPLDTMSNHSSALTRSKGDLTGISYGVVSTNIACSTDATGFSLEVISIDGTIVGKVVEALWNYVKKHLTSASVYKMHKKAKKVVKEVLSNENFAENYATRAIEAVEKYLLQLLSNKINNCYMVAITEQENRLCACNEEIERLNKEKAFFQQLNEKAAQVYNSARNLQL